MKILGLGLCGPGEADRYLEETLKEFKRLTDDVIICLCNAGPKEKMLIRKYGFRSYEDNREWGYHQPSIKTDLLKRAVQLKMDWHLVLDMDETVPTVDRTILEELTQGRIACQFYVTNLWNDTKHYAQALGFFNVRFYKHIPGMETQFLRKSVHCGNAPPFFYAQPPVESYIPHLLLHKGLMTKKDRQHRVVRYQKYDPKCIHKGKQYYEALATTFAGSEYTQSIVINRILIELNKIYDTRK